MREHLDQVNLKSEEEIYRYLSNRYNLPVEVIKHIVAHQFNTTRHMLIKLDAVEVKLRGLGSFKTSSGAIRYNLEQWFKAYREGKVTRDLIARKVKRLWKAKKYLDGLKK